MKQESFLVEGQPPACQFWAGSKKATPKMDKSLKMNRRTDTTENIISEQTTYAGGKKPFRGNSILL